MLYLHTSAIHALFIEALAHIPLQIGKPFLPDGLNHADSTTLKGPNVLQILTVEDVSKPSKGVGTSSQRYTGLTAV